MMRCATCDAEIPEGGNFCVECGAPAPQQRGAEPIADGPTVRLREAANGPMCSNCGTQNPAGAAFCVTCGRSLVSQPTAEPPPRPTLTVPEPLAPVGGRTIQPQPRQRGLTFNWTSATGGVWLIGIAILAITGWWWPGIMVLVGLSALLGAFGTKEDTLERLASLQGVLWTFGIAVIAVFGWWWPGMLVLVGLSVVLGAFERPKSQV